MAADRRTAAPAHEPPPPFAGFPAGAFAFLRGLRAHNDKAWFDAHRAAYDDDCVGPARAFVAAAGPKLRRVSRDAQFDPRIGGSLFRIHRDVRFTKDKRPYKEHVDAWFWHGADDKGWGAPGFFFRLHPDGVLLGVGMHEFERDALARYRAAVVDDKQGAALARVVAGLAKDDRALGAPTRTKVPRGFDAGHPRASLLLHEGLWAEAQLTARDAAKPSFVDACLARWAAMWPLGKWLRRNVAA